MNQIPGWAKNSLKAADAAKISDAISRAEKACGAEFVPVIVRRSSGIGHVGLSAGLLSLAAIYYFRLNMPSAPDAGWRPLAYSVAEAILAGALGLALSQLAWVQRLFTPAPDREQAVGRRARLEFYKHHVERTQTGNGVLLFVSLFERKAVVLCGAELAKKIPARDWDAVVRTMIQGAKSGALGQGMADAIEQSAELVGKHLRAKKKLKNELPDRLIVKE